MLDRIEVLTGTGIYNERIPKFFGDALTIQQQTHWLYDKVIKLRDIISEMDDINITDEDREAIKEIRQQLENFEEITEQELRNIIGV